MGVDGKIMKRSSGGRKKKMAIATNRLEEHRRLAKIRSLLAPGHAKAKAAGITEKDIRKDVAKALKERYDGKSGY